MSLINIIFINFNEKKKSLVKEDFLLVKEDFLLFKKATLITFVTILLR